MDLFSNSKEKPEIAKEFDETWWNELGSYMCNSESFDRLLIDLEEERKSKIIYPNDEDVFKVFKLLPLNKIKVVIVGQDPYFNGNADGIGFSCKQNLSPSLRQIFYAMHKDLNLPVKKDQSISLNYLLEQGVFLYNPILTVDKDRPLSHANRGWEEFSKQVFKAISNQKSIVWLLWGKKAQDTVNNIISYENHLILSSEHPAAAARNNRVWLVRHFTETNRYLSAIKKEEIKWLK